MLAIVALFNYAYRYRSPPIYAYFGPLIWGRSQDDRGRFGFYSVTLLLQDLEVLDPILVGRDPRLQANVDSAGVRSLLTDTLTMAGHVISYLSRNLGRC